MNKWLLTVALLPMLACPPADRHFAGGGNSLDDTGSTGDDTGDTKDTSDCPPSFGDPQAEIDDYPGKGWVIEVTVPFEEGSCAITEGELYAEFDDGAGGTDLMGPLSIGIDAADVYVNDYNEKEGAGELFWAFTVDSSTTTVNFTMWIEFPDGSESPHLGVAVN